jgi:hypothetical protein
LEEKIAIYLANACKLVIVADPLKRTLEMHVPGAVEGFHEPAVAPSSVYADLRIDLATLFAKL